MNLSPIANVIDAEYDGKRLIEVGLTTVDVRKLEILDTYSMPVKVDFEISQVIRDLTGWTNQKLETQGLEKTEIARRLEKYGCAGRLLVADHSNEIPSLRREFMHDAPKLRFSRHILNVTILFGLLTGKPMDLGLERMLAHYDLKFEGRSHGAAADSYNIARLLVEVLREASRNKAA